MANFIVEQSLRGGVPMVELDLITENKPPDGEEPLIFRFTGIIDTGSPACIVNTGVLPDYFFQDGLPSKPFWALSGVFENCRCATMGIWFIDHWKGEAFPVPVFEKPLGDYKHGDAFMLLGRSFLDYGTLTYDGPHRRWSWAYVPNED